MALRGNLRDFSLPDVFQLVTFSKKTGVLRINRADGTDGSVWFRDGEVFFAQSNWHGEPLGERLVHANRITPSALAKALALREKESADGRRLGEILVEEGYITDKVLENFVQEQIQDTIFDLMRWDEGEFDFELLPDVVDEDIGLSVSIENVIMEGSRRLEEWTRIKKKIPSMGIVFKMATAPGEGTFEISLKPIEWNLLLLVDGTRSVSELASETSRTDFEVARIMYGLFSAGLLEVATDEEVEKLRAERIEREAVVAELKAQQAAVEAEATDAALKREAELEAEAEARSKAVQTENAEAENAEAEMVVSAPSLGADTTSLADRPEPEIPEFLAGDGGAASANDMAVFAEMMGAVLDSQVEPEPELEPDVEPQPLPEPEPELEPEAVPEPVQDLSIEFETDTALAADIPPAPSAEFPYQGHDEFTPAEPAAAWGELAGIDTFAKPEPVPGSLSELLDETLKAPADIDDSLAAESAPTDELPADGALEALRAELAAEAAESAQTAPEPAGPTGDLERDLMALGLGELPTGSFVEPFSEFGTDLEAGRDVEPVIDLRTDTFTDLVSFTAESTEVPLAAAELEPAVDDPSEGVSLQGIPDLSDILDSLDSGEALGGETEIVHTEELEDAPAVTQSAGVISTDAFLADIAGDSLSGGLSGGLGDELSALTGAGGSKRPTASVNKIPEAGSPIEIHRDQTVDKDLVLKIIEGIKGL